MSITSLESTATTPKEVGIVNKSLNTEPLPDATGGMPAHTAGSPTATATRLLSCLALAGPVFVAVAMIQILTRPGFDLTRQALSLLTLGSWGWVQSANFIVSGSLILAGGAG